jgi:ribonucleotide monophosphatase NagD (HAD superfamily)
MIKGVLLDLSGTVYIGNEPVPRAIEAIDRLHAQKVPLRYITNSSRVSRQHILDKLQSMGLDVAVDEIFYSPAGNSCLST